MFSKPNSALIIVGHGSTVNPDSSAPTLEHAAEIRRRGVFAEVACCFWKEEPSMREVLFTVESDEVYVVPNFISEGYFTQRVIPRELGLSGRVTQFGNRVVKYCEPVGNHPRMTELLLRRAAEVAPDVPPGDTSLFIVGHGTDLNDNSAAAAKREVARIRELGRYAEVLNAYMEEDPLISKWDALSTQPNVVVVPFFISDGLHSYEDIPVLLGIAETSTGPAHETGRAVFRRNPYELRGRRLYYASAIGTEPLFADVIVEQAAAFDASHSERATRVEEPRGIYSDAAAGPNVTGRDSSTPLRFGQNDCIAEFLKSGGERIGQVLIRGQFELCHADDFGRDDLQVFTRPEDARRIAIYDDDGKYRPLKTAPNLRHGWKLVLGSVHEMCEAIDGFYPAALGLLASHHRGTLTATPLRQTLERQSGMYAVTKSITDDEAERLVSRFCAGCLRQRLWSLEQTDLLALNHQPSTFPLICREACNLLVAEARTVVKSRA